MLVHVNVFVLVAAAAGAGLVSAQSISLSSACTTALTGLLTSPDAACLNPTSLLSYAVSSQKSIPDTIDQWLTGLCASGSCSNDSLAQVVTNVTTGCNAELAQVGISTDANDSIINIVQQAYPTARKVVCLKDDSTNKLCVPETISNLESIIGKLGVNDLSFVNLAADVNQLIASGLPNITCTNCIKEAYTIARQDFPDIFSNGDISSPIVSLCGASFIDGSHPDDISETANSKTFSLDNSSVLSRGSVFNMAITLLFVSSAFVFLG